MIDLEKAEREFKKYVNQYDVTDGKIQLKIRHTYQVVKMSRKMALDLKLNKEEVELAQLIGLLHDIGRFEQLKVTNGYVDFHGFDHAEYGVKVLFEENKIRDFIVDDQYDSILYQAIKNHNKYQINTQNLSDSELLHIKLIRDSDKTDIFRVNIEEKGEDCATASKEKMEIDNISSEVYYQIKQKQMIHKEVAKTPLDRYLTVVAYPFDYNFTVGLQYVKKENFVNRLINKFNYQIPETKQKMQEIQSFVNQYIDNRIQAERKRI